MIAPQLHASDTTQAVALAIMALGAAILTVHCLRDAIRLRFALPILALLGGVVALPIEPFWDVNALFTFASNSHPIGFTAFGRAIPLYLAFIYPAFIGWGAYLGYVAITRGWTRRQLLAIPIGFWIADAVIEIVGDKTQLWGYYGPQTFRLFGWPIYFGALNGMIPLLGGALLVVLDRRLHGLERIGMVFAVPTAYIGIYAAAGWPVWYALNAHLPRVIDWLAACVLFALCWMTARLVVESVRPRQSIGSIASKTSTPSTSLAG